MLYINIMLKHFFMQLIFSFLAIHFVFRIVINFLINKKMKRKRGQFTTKLFVTYITYSKQLHQSILLFLSLRK